MNSCLIKPSNHLLWDELSEFLGQGNRKLIKYWYNVAHDQEFLNLVGDQLEYNSEGEPTFASLMRAAGTTQYKELVKNKLNELIGAGKMSYQEAIERLQSFNKSTPFKLEYMATITPVENSNQVELSIVEKTTTNQLNLHKFIKNRSLQDRIKYYLNLNGVDYTFLEEGEKSFDGRYSTQNVEQTESGLLALILVAHGADVNEVLAEEAGHFAIGALGKSPLVKRLEALLSPEIQREVLGDLYNTKDLGKNPRREVAGYLVGLAIKNNVDTKTPFGKLAERIKQVVKQIFAKLTRNGVKQAKLEAEKIALKIAESFMSEDFNGSVEAALETSETLYDRLKSGAELLFNDFSKRLQALQKKLRALNPEDAKKIDDIIDEMELGKDWTETFAEESAMQGIAQVLASLANKASDIQNIFMRIDEDFSDDVKFWENFYQNGKDINYCNEFCKAVLQMLEMFERASTADIESSRRLTSDMYVTLYDKYGRPYEADIRLLAMDLQGLIVGKTITYTKDDGTVEKARCEGLYRDVKAKGVDFFTKFCEESLGRKYIIRAKRVLFLNWHKLKKVEAQKYTVRQMIDTLEEDTHWFGRLFGSLGNSSDVISQIVFKAYKAAKKKADNDTNKVWDLLRELKKEASSIGIRNPRYFCEVMEDEINELDFIVDLLYRESNYEYNRDTHELRWIKKTNEVLEKIKKGEALDDNDYITIHIDPYPNRGSLTGNILTLYDLGKYEWQYNTFKKAMLAKFKAENPGCENWTDAHFGTKWQSFFRPLVSEFKKATFIKTTSGDKVLNDNYLSKQYAEKILHVDTSKSDWRATAKLIYYNEPFSPERLVLEKWMNIKKSLDAKLPEGSCPPYRMPLFRGDFLDRWKNKRSNGDNFLVSGVKVGLNYLSEEFSYDTSLGDYGSDLHYTTEEELFLPNPYYLEDEAVNRLPLYGINKMKDMTRISTDIFGSLLAYANMANKYSCMDYIIHALEIGRNVIGGHRVLVDDKGDIITNPPKSNKIKLLFDKLLGANHVEKASNWKEILDKGVTALEWHERAGSTLNVYSKYCKFLDKQLYGHQYSLFFRPGSALAKNVQRIAVPIIRAITSIGSTLALAGSPMVSIMNLLDGINEMLKEAHSGEHFNKRDLLRAHLTFMMYMPLNWVQGVGLRFTRTKVKDDKISLLLRQFNIDENNTLRHRNWNTKGRLKIGKLIKDFLYWPMSAGSVYLNVVPYIAMMLKTKLYNSDGLRVSLWKAYRVSGGSMWNPKSNRRLELLEDYYPTTERMELHEALSVTYNRIKDYIDLRSDKTDAEFNAITEADRDNIKNLLDDDAIDYLTSKKMQLFDGDGNLKVTRYDLNRLLNALRTQKDLQPWNAQDEADFMTKCRLLCNYLHGIYDTDNKGLIDLAIVGLAWSCMKGYAFGMIANAWTPNRYNIFDERPTGQTYTDENGDVLPIIDGEMDGFMLTGLKLFRNLFSLDHVLKNTMLTFCTAFLAVLGGTSIRSKGVENMQAMGFDSRAFYNIRRMTASIMASLILGSLGMLLKRAGEDDDEIEGNPWDELKVGGIKNKEAKEWIIALSKNWEDGKIPDFNYAKFFCENAEIIFKNNADGKESYEFMLKIAKMYDEGKNLSRRDQEIDWKGVALYFITRALRDNDAFVNLLGMFDKDESFNSELRGFTALKSAVSVGMMMSTFSLIEEIYGDMRYSDLHSALLSYIDTYNNFMEYCRKNKIKYHKSLQKTTDEMIEYYQKYGEVPDYFADCKDYISFLAENQEEYKTIKDLNSKVFNKYYLSKSDKSGFYKKNEPKWRKHLDGLTPWIRGRRLLYDPELTLNSFMFAVRNQ